MPKKTASLPIRIARTLLLAYVGIVAFLYFFQRRLQYQPDVTAPLVPTSYVRRGLEEVRLTASDGVELHAWFWPADGPGTIVLFHGNAGHRGHRLQWMGSLQQLGWSVFLLDYRGYGGSAGSPTEQGLHRDGEATWAWLEENTKGKVVLFGVSLGGGVATELAHHHLPDGLILQSTFTSTADVARTIYPFLPVGWLMKDRYESVRRIPTIRCPLLAIHGDQDEIVPYRLGRQLFEAAGEPKEWHTVEGAGHNDLLNVAGAEYWKTIEQFLARVAAQD